nr:unnamed protein product [Digitaria exilis]
MSSSSMSSLISSSAAAEAAMLSAAETAVRRYLALEQWVHDVLEGPLPPAHGVIGEADLLPWQARVQRRSRAKHLEEHDTEGVDVRLLRELLPPEVLRVQIAEASLHHGAHVRLVHGCGASLGQTEVGDLGHPVLVDEDVGRLDVAVDDGVLGSRVEIVQAPRGADGDLEALPPRQRRLTGLVQVLPERAVSHVVVHEYHLAIVLAAANERDEVLVPELGEHLDLGLELENALLRRRVAPFDGHLGVAVNDAPVYLAKPSHANHQRLVEVLGCCLDLLEREVPAHGGDVRVEYRALATGRLARLPPYTGSHPEECETLVPSARLFFDWYATTQMAATIPKAAAPPAALPITAALRLLGFSLNFPCASSISASSSILDGSGFGPARLPELSLILNISRPLSRAS